MNTPYLSVLLPIYNEADAVGDVITDIVTTMQATGIPFEVIAVNDGSQDCTQEILLEKLALYPDILRIARHVENKGNSAAARTGIRLARGQILASMDSDGQHVASEIPRLLKMIPPNDMVVGARTKEYQGVWYRNLGNFFYNRLASWLIQRPVLDLTSGFRLMRREAVLHFVDLYQAGFSSEITVTMAFFKAGYTVSYAPIEVRKRVLGQSKVSVFKDGYRFFVLILQMAMLYDPLRIFVPVSAVLALLGILSMVAGSWVAGQLEVPGSSVVLFIAAVLAILIGLVSTQISNTMIRSYGDEYIELIESSPNS